MFFLGGSWEWSKEIGYKSSFPKVKELKEELKRVGKAVVKHFSVLYQSVLVVAHNANVCAKKNLSRTLSLVMEDIEK
jgi:hypothetical protein